MNAMSLPNTGEHTGELVKKIRLVVDSASPPGGDRSGYLVCSPVMRRVIQIAREIAIDPVPVIIFGETGAGKTEIARLLHESSRRKERVFRVLDCTAICGEFIEVMLFGNDRGAYTGANCARDGIFQEADKGTIFLDEISELTSRAQARLLQVLEDGTFRRLGGSQTRKVDVRVIAATNKPLLELVEKGEFRADLYHRLGVFQITIPPLRERSEDILPLAHHFLGLGLNGSGGSLTISPDAKALLLSHAWPGNVRELKNLMAVLQGLALRRGGEVTKELLQAMMQGDLLAIPPL